MLIDDLTRYSAMSGRRASATFGRDPIRRVAPSAAILQPLISAIPSPAPRALATLALVGAILLWGTSFVATKPVLAHLSPLTLTFLRVVVALVVLVPAAHLSGDRPALGRTPALLGLTGVALAVVCQNFGLRFASAADAALILNGGIPMLSLILAALVLRERLPRRGLAGVAASLAGVVTLVSLGAGEPASGGFVASLRGDALLLGSAASFAVYTVLGRRTFGVAPGGETLATVAGSFAYGALFLLPVAASELAIAGLTPPPLDALLLLLYLGAGCSALAFLMSAYALARLEAGRVAVILNLELVVGVAVAALLLSEPVTPARLAGGGLHPGRCLAGRDWAGEPGAIVSARGYPPGNDRTCAWSASTCRWVHRVVHRQQAVGPGPLRCGGRRFTGPPVPPAPTGGRDCQGLAIDRSEQSRFG